MASDAGEWKPTVGTLCQGQWDDGCWYRVVVESIVEGVYVVTYTDFAEKGELTFQHLRHARTHPVKARRAVPPHARSRTPACACASCLI
jgi:hypothetical protein